MLGAASGARRRASGDRRPGRAGLPRGGRLRRDGATGRRQQRRRRAAPGGAGRSAVPGALHRSARPRPGATGRSRPRFTSRHPAKTTALDQGRPFATSLARPQVELPVPARRRRLEALRPPRSPIAASPRAHRFLVRAEAAVAPAAGRPGSAGRSWSRKSFSIEPELSALSRSIRARRRCAAARDRPTRTRCRSTSPACRSR